jgi:hypothetical protein
MTGAIAANPHEGSRSEILADYLFSSWGTVTPVRRQDDYGIDLYCTPTDRIGLRAVVRDYYVVQVKSGTDPWVFDYQESVRWLVEYPTPLFLACIDKKSGTLRVYHVTPRFYVWAMAKLPNRLVLTPQDTVDGLSVQWENAEAYSLSAPIIPVTCSDLISDEKIELLKHVFTQWVRVDRENCDLVRKGLLRFRMPASYRTNEAPPGNIVEAGVRAPEPEFMKRGIQTLAECAECVGGQLGQLDDLSGALRAALLVDHLTRKYSDLFANLPRWQGKRVPADLGMIVVQALNQFLEEKDGASPYRYRGIDEVQKALDNDSVVRRFLMSKASGD